MNNDMNCIANKRNSNIELFRFILMNGICLWHMLVHGMNIKNIINIESDISYSIYILLCLCVPCVNSFMLISGFYGMKLSNKLIKFSLKGLLYFLPITIIIIIFNDGMNKWNIIYILRHLFTMSTYVWWFLTDYVLVLILSPIINNGIASLSKRNFLFIIIGLLFINSFGIYINFVDDGSNVQSLLVLYLIGRYIGIYGINLKRNVWIIFWICSTFFILCELLIFDIIGHQSYNWWVLYYNNPIIIIQSVSLFMIVISFKSRYSTLINLLGRHCLSIYMITELIGMYIYHQWALIYDKNPLLCLIIIPLCCLICILIDIFISSTVDNLSKLLTPYEKIFISFIRVC